MLEVILELLHFGRLHEELDYLRHSKKRRIDRAARLERGMWLEPEYVMPFRT